MRDAIRGFLVLSVLLWLIAAIPGPAGDGARTITETGAPAGAVNDGAGHPSTLVSIFCIPPTFNATVDAAGDLPGPGAVSLPGTAQLLP